jgi:putative membrane protein
MKALPLIALTLAAARLFTPVSAFAADDGAFLTKAMQGDSAEVAMGMMAEKRGTIAKTRAYGRMLANDHSAHRMKLVALAHSMGVKSTMALSDEAKQKRAVMLGIKGAAFDAAFKQDMIVDHQKDITEYQMEAKSAQSPKVRQMAQNTLPTLNKHLAAARSL